LPELPLLAVLPGTGGLTRLVDKRKVRHDVADFFCTTSEGVRGGRAVDWRLVDELVPRSRFDDMVRERAQQFVEKSDRPPVAQGIKLTPLARTVEHRRVVYEHLMIDIDRELGVASFMLQGPKQNPPQEPALMQAAGASFWPLAVARELDDAVLHLRLNEVDIGVWVFRSKGDNDLVQAVDAVLTAHQNHWLVREIILCLKRTLKRVDVSSRSLIALIEPGSCFTGTLLELVFAADRAYMLDGTFEDNDMPPASIRLTRSNFGPLPMANDQTRLHRRFLADPEELTKLRGLIGQDLNAEAAENFGLVTFIPDEIDWEDEVRLAIEERASFSPDALTGMEASLRFGGPETLESKIFGRLSAWQNWIFQRPNATGEDGALSRYGTGKKSRFDKRRV
jgi:benzoyl-CoA-dihydrodiol lyase